MTAYGRRETRYQCQIGKCRKHVRSFPCWEDLIDHLVNQHKMRIVDGKLMHYNMALTVEGEKR